MEHFAFHAILGFVFPRQKRRPISGGREKRARSGRMPAGLPTTASRNLSPHGFQAKRIAERVHRLAGSVVMEIALPLSPHTLARSRSPSRTRLPILLEGIHEAACLFHPLFPSILPLLHGSLKPGQGKAVCFPTDWGSQRKITPFRVDDDIIFKVLSAEKECRDRFGCKRYGIKRRPAAASLRLMGSSDIRDLRAVARGADLKHNSKETRAGGLLLGQ